MDQIDIALLIARIWLGVVMVMHGINHARSLDGTERWFASVGFSHSRLFARLSAYAELAIGLGIAFGIITALAVAGMAGTLFVAFWTIHRFAGFFVFHRPDEGYEFVATLVVLGLVIAIVGPGEISVDHALGIADELGGLVGALIVAGGLIFGWVQVAVFWTRPEKED